MNPRRKKPDLTRLRITPELSRLLTLSLVEDVGSGDVTSLATIPETQRGAGHIFVKEAGIICGLEVARRVLYLVDRRARLELLCSDGDTLARGQSVARVAGPMRSILTAERVMLNFLQRLSGIATLTGQFVETIREAGSDMQVVDTRKTTPLWRKLERHAVRAGGGGNHRFALYDMYLVKNNHIDAAGSPGEALRRIRQDNAARKRKLPIAIEARNLSEVREILAVGADLILLDNMRPTQIRRAVELIGNQAQTELTGGVSLRRMRTLARLPVDRVSIGALTHSAPSLDISLHVDGNCQ